MEALVAAIGKTENIALIVLMLMCAALGYAFVRVAEVAFFPEANPVVLVLSAI